MELKVLTYNIHKGFDSTQRKYVLHKIRDAISELGADIVFLQEVQGEHTKKAKQVPDWSVGTQVQYLAEGIWPHFVYGKNAVYTHGHHGNAILSRYPIIEWSNTDISTNRFEARGMLHVVVKAPGLGKPLHCVCVHLNLFPKSQGRQLRSISEKLLGNVPEDSPLLMAGDFNDWGRKACAVLADTMNLTETFRSIFGVSPATFPSRLPVLHLDRIYSRGLKPTSAQVLSGKPWSTLSDHAALYAEFGNTKI